ncbi:MAG TPA: glycosyltransferase, partial [Candidatus Limnocylindria bacterium]|nr:glycosyltransferase [Candidatus Limnocylindria bacterium]
MLVRNVFTHDSRVEKEARTLTAAGYRVTVVAEAASGLPLAEQRDGYAVVRVSRPIPRLPLLRFFAYRRRLVAALRRTRPHVLHAHDSNALEPVAAVARDLRVPFVYDGHELWLQQTRRGRPLLYWWAFLAWYRFVERRYLRRAAAWITVSPSIARHLEREYGLAHVESVPNYPDLGVEARRRELRSLPGGNRIPDGAPIVLYLGALLPGRGLEQLISAMADVPEAHLVFLGEGGLRLALEERAATLGISDRVHILDPVPPADVVAYAASATVGVAPGQPVSLSYTYSLPNKLFESMAAGLPVVASDFPEVRRVLEREQAGVIVDARRPEAIADALRELLADPVGAARMGANGRQAVRERYNWSVSADALVKVYAGLRRRRRLLVFTRIWPSDTHPASGIFVSNRFRGIRGVNVVVGQPSRHWLLGTLRFLLVGLTVRGRYDGVEAHVLYPAGLVGLVAARLRGVPLLAYAHGTDVRAVASRGPVYRFLVRTVARRANLVVTNSADTAALVERLGARAEVIPPGVDTDLFQFTPRPAERRVLYLGGASDVKGHDVAARLADTLAGPGIRELPPAQVARLMAEHDVVLVPSRAEGLGMVALEAIASGRWVVARAVGGLR